MNFVCLNFVCMNFGGLGADTVLGGPRDPPVKTLAVLHHMHRARLPHTTQVRCHLTLFILSCCVGRLFFGASEIGHTRWPTEIFAHGSVEIPAYRSNPCHFPYVHPFPQQSI